MDNFNPNPGQMPPQMPQMMNEPPKKSIGPLIAVIIILALIIVGGLYFLKQRSSPAPVIPQPEGSGDAVIDSLDQQSNSDELDSIEADLNSTDFDNLDQGAAAIEAQL